VAHPQGKIALLVMAGSLLQQGNAFTGARWCPGRKKSDGGTEASASGPGCCLVVSLNAGFWVREESRGQGSGEQFKESGQASPVALVKSSEVE